MANLSICDILDLIGNNLDDTTSAKDRFREFLLKDQWQPQDFSDWLRECGEKGSQSERVWYNAMQDIAVAVGRRLGFSVEFGRYSGSTTEIAFDGLWRSKSGAVILVEVKASGWPVSSVGQLGEYVKKYAQSMNAEVYGLYVIGSSEFQHLIDQIKGGEYRNLLRLIAFEDLLRLWQLKVDLDEVSGQDAAAERIQSIILPMESVNLGNLVRLLLEIAELKTAAVTEEEGPPDSETKETVDVWQREELTEFFRNNTDWQNAFLTALVLADEERVFSDRLVKLSARVATKHIPGLSGKELKTFAGVRAGFKMRRGTKEDFIGNDWASDGEKWQSQYWIRPPYKEWILQWVQGRGWDMPAAPAE